MTFEFKPTNNFFSDFGQSLKDNLTDFNLTFDGTGSVATVIETFAQKLSESNGTVASIFIATSNFIFTHSWAINLLLIYRGENNGDALGHARNSAVAIDALQSRADHPSALVREHVAWALERHSSNNEDSRRLKNK
ncbi:MAG TPA: HEAT repeat domain-containing protein [Gallionella sp.]|nr:HEAT repeat domain-containing protein [Gallionella sp.]